MDDKFIVFIFDYTKTGNKMIRATITAAEFEKLTWMSLSDVASDINDVDISINNEGVLISVLGFELKTMSVEDYKSIVN